MHPDLATLFRGLKQLREAAGLSREDVERELVLGPGWVERIEQGKLEPSLGTLAALLDAYGSSLPKFFEGLGLSEGGVAVDRHLAADEDGEDLLLHFPMGSYSAAVRLEEASIQQFNEVILVMRDELAAGRKREAVARCFLKAVELWPHLNPSDLWYFLVSHAYQDDYNHPATDAGKDWPQSWKRAGGWALEQVFVEHYNPYLLTKGIRLRMITNKAEAQKVLNKMGITDESGAEKSDVFAFGVHDDGSEEPFGVVHVKASFAERRTDDVPLSQELIAKGYASPLITMDGKAAPSDGPVNRGELGAVQGGEADVSSKRFDIERHRKFDACFSYNRNTLATPEGQPASARIHVCDFSDPDDGFSRYLDRKWRERQGLE